MIRSERAARSGAPAPEHRRPRPTRLLAALVATLVAMAGFAFLPASPAGADDHTIDQDTDFTLACTAQTPLGPQSAEFPLTVSTSYESPVPRGQTTQLTISQPPLEIPTELEGFQVKRVTNVQVRLKAPANFQVMGTSVSGSNYPTTGWNSGGMGTAGYSAATNLINLQIPGPIVPPTEVQPPNLHVDLKAIGRVGTAGDLRIDSFQLEAVIVVSGIGDVVVSMSCPTPNPNPSLAHLEVASGSFVPQREPVTQQLQTFGSCTINHGGTGGFISLSGTDYRTTVHTPRFLMSSVKDVQPGETLQVEVALQPYDVIAVMNTHSATMSTLLGGTTMRSLALHVLDWRADFEPPAGFSVQSVSTGPGMNASYNPATNRIRWARPTGTAGQFGGGAFSPSPLVINLVATGPVTTPVTYSPLRFKGMGFRVEHENWTNLGIAPIRNSNSTKNVNCNQGGYGSGNSNNGNFPSNPSGSPSTNMQPTPGVPYHQRIGWPTPINSWPAALNVGTANSITNFTQYENNWNNNGVVGTVGIANRPTAVNDVAGPVNNAGAPLSNSAPHVDINVLTNDDPGSSPIDPEELEIIDWPENGELTFPSPGVVRYKPDLGTPFKSDVFTYVVGSVEALGSASCPHGVVGSCNTGQITSRVSNLAQVNIDIHTSMCIVDDPRGECVLSGFDGHWVAHQIITAEVVGDALTMEQSAGELTLYEETDEGLQDLVLDGTPKPAVGLLNTLTVTDRRGEGGKWDVTAQVTDFKETEASPDCPASNSSTWDWRCIPGDNLGWAPMAKVDHVQVPGDVAAIIKGSDISSGLQSTAQQLCRAPLAQAGGTFECGADLTLMTPASAAAQTYQATLTITLVG